MKTLECYQSARGTLHLSEYEARREDEDSLGEELDGLLRLFKLDITRTQEHKGILQAMKSKEELLKSVRTIINILEHHD